MIVRKIIICSLLTLVIFYDESNSQTYNDYSSEPVKKFQLQEATLPSLTTKDLIREYLTSGYPGYLFLYTTDINESLSKAYNDFNGLREMLNRPDVAYELCDSYKNLNVEFDISQFELQKKATFTFSFCFLEVLISDSRVINQLTLSQTKELITDLLKKIEFKKSHPETFSRFDLQINSYCIARIIESKGIALNLSQLSESYEIKNLLEAGKFVNDNTLSTVIINAKQFLNSL